MATAQHLKQIFSKDLEKKLFPDNSYMLKSKNDTAFLRGDQVNIPQGTSDIAVQELSSYAKDARISVQRTDESIAYNVKQFKTKATFLQDSEDLVVNYSKRMSLVEQHADEIMAYLGNFVQREWGSNSTSKVLRTTGDNRSATSGTGNRKAIKFEDLLNVRKTFRDQDIPVDGLCALISPEMEMDLLKITEITDADYSGGKSGIGVLRMGEVDRFLRIDFFVRSKINLFSNATTPTIKSLNATAANADNAGAIFWHPNYVSLAKGSVKTLYEQGQPGIGGDEISSIARCGALYRRKDGKGVVNLVETAES